MLAALVMAVAATVERRLGPSAAGWVAALPAGLAVAIVAVTLDARCNDASTMGLSVTAHVPAQLLFAIVFAAVLARRALPSLARLTRAASSVRLGFT